MIEPPIRNIGIRGIQLAAERIPCWPEQMNIEELRLALFNIYIFISPVGGTGGGAFRYMFSRFLRKAAGLSGNNRLAESAAVFQEVGDQWEKFASLCKQVSETHTISVELGECTGLLASLAKQEQSAWKMLLEITK
jgi:hypothetical protein